jgi:hypothetical protein
VPLYGEHTLSLLRDGVVVIAGAARDEEARQIGDHSLFTGLILEGLEGGEADIFGDVTASSLYAYVDERLGEFDQRPILKANVSRLLPLRRAHPRVTRANLDALLSCFRQPSDRYTLDPRHDPELGCPDPELVERFQHLKDLRDVGLVKQDQRQRDFYSTAKNSSYVELTDRGRHVWQRVTNDLV